MGNKGDRLTNDAAEKADLLIEKLSVLGIVTSKKMFGGYGIFTDGKMFGMVDSKGQGFLKVDENLAKEFKSIGSIPHSKMPYSSIPEDIVSDQEKLLELAGQSILLLEKSQ